MVTPIRTRRRVLRRSSQARVAPQDSQKPLKVTGHAISSPSSTRLTTQGRRTWGWGRRLSRGAVSSIRPPIPATPASPAWRLAESRGAVLVAVPLQITPLPTASGSAAGSLRRKSLRGLFSRRRSDRVAPMTPGQAQQEAPRSLAPPPALDPVSPSPKKQSPYVARQQERRRTQEVRREDEAELTLKKTTKRKTKKKVKKEEGASHSAASPFRLPITPVKASYTIDHKFIVDRIFGGAHIIFPDERAGSRRDEKRDAFPDFGDIKVRNLIRQDLALALAMRIRRFPGTWIGTISNAFKRQDATLIFIQHYALVRSDLYDEFKTTDFYRKNQAWLDVHLDVPTKSDAYWYRDSLFQTYDWHPYQLLITFQLHNMSESFFMKAIVPYSRDSIRKIEILGRIVKENGFLFRPDRWHIETDETLAEEGLNPYRLSPATLEAKMRG